MLVDLICIKECFVDVQGIGTHRHCLMGQRFDDMEVEGDEVWLKFFNAYKPQSTIPPPEPIEQILIEDVGAGDEELEQEPEAPTPQDIGAGTELSIEVIKERMSKQDMINALKSNGLKLANDKWNIDTLAKHIQKRQLCVG